MNANLSRIHELTNLMDSKGWVDSHFIIDDETHAGVYATCVYTCDTYAIMRWILPTGSFMGMHIHDKSCEVLTCVEGEMPLYVGDKEMELKAGDTVTVPCGVPHGALRRFMVDSEIIATTIPPAPEFDREGGCCGGTS